MRTTVAHDGQTPLERYSTAALATSALGGAWVLGRDLLPFDAACPILEMTGVPCPFCGFTRLADHLASGDVTLALTTDPAGTSAPSGREAAVAMSTPVGNSSATKFSPSREVFRIAATVPSGTSAR